MKKNNIPIEFVYQLFALIVAVIIVHGYYVSVVEPNANQIQVEQNIEAENNQIMSGKIGVGIDQDFEQESCFILMLWALAIMGFKLGLLMNERKLLDADLISVAEGMTILPRDTRELERQIETLNEKERKMVLPRALLSAQKIWSNKKCSRCISGTFYI